MRNNEKALELAIDRINATQISPRRWAHYANETSSWYVVSRKTLVDLGERLINKERDAYSFWCAETEAKEMPKGWTPE